MLKPNSYKYMVADVTGTSLRSPVQDSANVPLYLGSGPEVPVGTFMKGGKAFQAIVIFDVGHPLNPFSVPLVAACEISGS